MRCAFLGNNVTPSSAFPATAPNLIRKNSTTVGRLELLSPWLLQLSLAGPSGRSHVANIVAFSASSYPEKPLPNAYSTVLAGARKSQAQSDSPEAPVPAKHDGKNLGLLRQMLELVGLFPSTSWHPSATVHPTAAVDPHATLGEGVYVGPHSTIGPNVKLGEGCYVGPGVYIAGETHIGPRCVLQSGAVVGSEDPGTTILGHDNVVGHHAVIGVQCQDLKYQGGECFLTVGNGNDFREHVQIHRSSTPDLCTSIGSHNLIMGGCHVAHDCIVGSGNILANNTLLAGHVQVGDYAVMGGAVAIKPFCHIGSYAFLAGGAMVEGDVPACVRAKGDRAELMGVNTEGLKRNGYDRQQIVETQRTCSTLLGTGVATGGSSAATALRELAQEMLDNGKWGVAPEAVVVEGSDGQHKSEPGRRHPAILLLQTVAEGQGRDRSPGPCRWRRADKVAQLETKVAELEVKLDAFMQSTTS